MATITELTTARVGITTNAATYTTASATPTASAMIAVFIGVTTETGTDWTVTDSAGGTYTKITLATGSTRMLKAASADFGELWVRNAPLGASPAAMTWTLSHASGAASGGTIRVLNLAGITRSGAAAVRSVGKTDNAAASTTPTAVMNQAALTTNPVAAFLFIATSGPATTVPTSFTSLGTTGYATPTTGSMVVVRNSGHTSATVAWGSTTTTAYGVIAVEFDSSAAADTTPPISDFVIGAAGGKISRVVGFDAYSYSFTVNEACQAWKIKIVPSTSSLDTAGVLLESGGAVASGATVSGTITDDEIVAAEGGVIEGAKIVKVFVQDTAGNWSV